MTKTQKQTLFLAKYRETLNKSKSMFGLFAFSTFYKWYNSADDSFKKKVDEIEMALLHSAEESYYTLLQSEDDRVVFNVAKEIINSKVGKKYSNLAEPDKNVINVDADKIEYIVK